MYIGGVSGQGREIAGKRVFAPKRTEHGRRGGCGVTPSATEVASGVDCGEESLFPLSLSLFLSLLLLGARVQYFSACTAAGRRVHLMVNGVIRAARKLCYSASSYDSHSTTSVENE